MREWRRKTFELIEEGTAHNRASVFVDRGIITLIVLNVAAVVLETVPEIHAAYGPEFLTFEIFSGVIFTVEYVLRLWVVPEHWAYRSYGPVAGRIRYMFTFGALIDLVAILPYLLAMFTGADLRVLRVLRLVRFLKLARYSPALATLQRSLYEERRALVAALVIMVGLLVLSATAAYYAERDVQPEAFGSIPAAMWWALATLTTVGYGDVTPVTMIGKIIGGMVMIFGLGVFALPVGIVAMGFTTEVHRREFIVTWSMVARVPIFEQMPAKEVGRFTKLLRSRRVSAGGVVLRNGDPTDHLFFIAKGEVDVTHDGRTHRMGEGDHFGEIPILNPMRNQVTAVAVTNVELMELDSGDFLAMLHRNPDIRKQVHDLLAERWEKDIVPVP